MKPAKLAATVSSRTTGQLREAGFAAPSRAVERSAASRPIASGSSAAGERPMPKPSPVWRSSACSAIAER